MTQTYNVAIVGATGLVGEAIISMLEERKFPVAEIFPLASERSVAETVLFNRRPRLLGTIDEFDFSKVQLAFFATPASVSARYADRAAKAGCVVIDHSACFRQQDDVPLVVSEVNPECVAAYKKRNIIACPNAASTQLLVALKPVYDAVGISRINVATYQSVSGSGKKAVEDLARQTTRLLNAQSVENSIYPQQIAFNVLPQVGQFQEDGHSSEEQEIVQEITRIFADSQILVSPSCVRVSVFHGCSEAVHIETDKKISTAELRKLFEESPGIELVDSAEEGEYPTPVSDGVGGDEVLIGRIREDISCPQGINLWLVADNVRKGAAFNSVQIAEILIKDYI